MGDGFAGFGSGTFDWFAGLERDNSKAYFTATREQYDTQVRAALAALLETLREEFGGELKVFRQQRDVRFSADKSPYKTRTYGVLERAPANTLYAEISARGLYAGTGYHRYAHDQLKRYRNAVVDDRAGMRLAALVDAARARGLEVEGQVLTTAPRGFPRDHPRVEMLRHKALIVGRRMGGGVSGIRREAALDHVAGTWRAAEPLVAWLDQHVGPSTLPPDPRRTR